jgi:hypothetical protein
VAVGVLVVVVLVSRRLERPVTDPAAEQAPPEPEQTRADEPA